MTKVNAGITTSLDGYIAEESRGEATGADKELLDHAYASVGAIATHITYGVVR